MMNQIQKEIEYAEKKFMPKRDNNGLVILSQENVAKVEAMIKMDSSYAKSFDINYQNSSAYLFNKLNGEIYNTIDSKKLKEHSYQTISDIVKAINRENSTRSSKIEMEEISDRISNLKIKDFIKYLKEPKNLELFNLISKKTSYPGCSRYRRNPSLASKFCHYACFYMFDGEIEQDNYSIYDGVLKKVLPLYAEKYGINCDEKQIEEYSYYREIVDKIIKKSKSNISRNGFDHLLWYCNKGRV